MRIVMIGHSNAGKTTYMSSMYELGRSGIKGFRIRTKDATQEPGLLRNADDIHRGTYPPPSAHRTEYDFVLSYHRREFFDFTWNDYRGGALLDRATDAETKAVLTDLDAADGIVVFVDAQALAMSDDSGREIRRLTVLLQRSLRERKRPVPLVVAYTKADLVPDDPAVWAAIRRPLEPITQAVNSGGDVIATDIAVSCGIAPRNVQVPLVWCLTHALTAKVRNLEAEVATSKRMERDARAQATVTNGVTSWWNGTQSYYQRAEQAKKWAKEELAELRPLQRPADQLAKALVKIHPPAGHVVQAERAAATAARQERRATFRSTKPEPTTGQKVATSLAIVVVVLGTLLFVGVGVLMSVLR